MYDARAQCIDGLGPLEEHIKNSKNNPLFVHLPVTEHQDCFCLFLEDETAFAIADQVTQDTLAALRQVPSVRFEAVLGTVVLSKRKKGLTRKSPVLEDISINVFGPQDSVVENEVAKRLSKVSGFLQHPKDLNSDIKYRNPQFFVVPGEEINFNDLIGVGEQSLETANLRARVRGEVDSILESLNVASVEEVNPLIHPNSLKARLTRQVLFCRVPNPHCYIQFCNTQGTQRTLCVNLSHPVIKNKPFALCLIAKKNVSRMTALRMTSIRHGTVKLFISLSHKPSLTVFKFKRDAAQA